MYWLIDSNKLTPAPTKANPRPKPVPDTDAVWEERIASVKAHRENVRQSAAEAGLSGSSVY
jgi:hypothetical protein